jgi:ribosomal protein S19E (S16A)
MHRGSCSLNIPWVYLRWAFVVRRLVSDGALGLSSRARRHLGHTNREIQSGVAGDARVEVGPLHQGRLDGILLASFSKRGL